MIPKETQSKLDGFHCLPSDLEYSYHAREIRELVGELVAHITLLEKRLGVSTRALEEIRDYDCCCPPNQDCSCLVRVAHVADEALQEIEQMNSPNKDHES